MKTSTTCMQESCVWVGVVPARNREDRPVKKSTASGNSNSCVYIGAIPGDDVDPDLIKISNHQDWSAPGLLFRRDEWDAFVTGVKAGEFDTDRLVSEARA